MLGTEGAGVGEEGRNDLDIQNPLLDFHEVLTGRSGCKLFCKCKSQSQKFKDFFFSVFLIGVVILV